MKEEIVSFETAMMAKEKGFTDIVGRIRGKHYYNYKGEIDGDCIDELKHRKENPNPFASIAAPSQSLLQRWLREEKGLLVFVEPSLVEASNKKGIRFTYFVVNMEDLSCVLEDESPIGFLKYEEALEKGLQMALTL